jgi:predicted nucleic acid-binding protein
MSTSTATTPEETIRKALQAFLETAEAANEAAVALTNDVLKHQKSLISEATIARETATLLLHVSQDLARTTVAVLETNEREETTPQRLSGFSGAD